MRANLLADGSEATGLAALVDRLRDPVDPGVTADLRRGEKAATSEDRLTYSLVVGVNEDDLVVLVDTVLVHPVRVENPEVTAPPANTLLRNTPQATLGLELVDTLANGLAEGGTCIENKPKTLQNYALHIPLGTCFLRLPRRTRTR